MIRLRQGFQFYFPFFLIILILGSVYIAGLSLSSLHPEDRINVLHGSALMCMGFLFFVSLFNLLNYFQLQTRYGHAFRLKYQLNFSEVLDISNKIVSSVQAILSCVTGTVVCAWSCTKDFIRSSHYLSEAYAWFGAAYFFYDIWSMYRVHEEECRNTNSFPVSSKNGSKIQTKGCWSVSLRTRSSSKFISRRLSCIVHYLQDQPIIIAHHLFIGSFGFLVIVYLRGGLGDCIFGFVYLMELSTPFVSFRSILSKLKLKSSTLYMANGMFMLWTFFLCRIVMFPYICYLYSRYIGSSIYQAVSSLPNVCLISTSIIFLPQIYWFLLMLRGAFKTFFQPSSKSANLKNSNGLHPNRDYSSGNLEFKSIYRRQITTKN